MLLCSVLWESVYNHIKLVYISVTGLSHTHTLGLLVYTGNVVKHTNKIVHDRLLVVTHHLSGGITISTRSSPFFRLLHV